MILSCQQVVNMKKFVNIIFPWICYHNDRIIHFRKIQSIIIRTVTYSTYLFFFFFQVNAGGGLAFDCLSQPKYCSIEFPKKPFHCSIFFRMATVSGFSDFYDYCCLYPHGKFLLHISSLPLQIFFLFSSPPIFLISELK